MPRISPHDGWQSENGELLRWKLQMSQLIDNQTGQVINEGDEVVTFRGEKAKLIRAFPNDGKTGKVKISILDKPNDPGYYFPSVIGAHFE
jgi:hypothetical protein